METCLKNWEQGDDFRACKKHKTVITSLKSISGLFEELSLIGWPMLNLSKSLLHQLVLQEDWTSLCLCGSWLSRTLSHLMPFGCSQSFEGGLPPNQDSLHQSQGSALKQDFRCLTAWNPEGLQLCQVELNDLWCICSAIVFGWFWFFRGDQV